MLAQDLVNKYFSTEIAFFGEEIVAKLKLTENHIEQLVILRDNVDLKAKKGLPFGFQIGKVKGSDLVGIKYERLLPFGQQKLDNAQNAFQVVVGDFVTTTDGTGIVHIAPSFGADDFQVARKNNIPALTYVDRRGEIFKLH